MIPRALNSIQQNRRFWDWLRTTLAGTLEIIYRTIDAIESQSMAAPRIQWSVACPPCCARTASGQATAAPPSSVMNSRLITRSPRRRGRVRVTAHRYPDVDCWKKYFAGEGPQRIPPQRRAADRRRKGKQLERRSRPRTAEPTATGFGDQPPEPIYASSLTMRKKRVVVEL
jgi:hypothetical protein